MSNALAVDELPDDGDVPPIPLHVRLVLARDYRELTQADMHERLGISTKTIGRYERGEFTPSRGTVLAWAMATRTSARWLLGDDTVPGPARRREASTVITGGQRPGTSPSNRHGEWFRWPMDRTA